MVDQNDTDEEMSMDDILASIRQYVSDETDISSSTLPHDAKENRINKTTDIIKKGKVQQPQNSNKSDLHVLKLTDDMAIDHAHVAPANTTANKISSIQSSSAQTQKPSNDQAYLEEVDQNYSTQNSKINMAAESPFTRLKNATHTAPQHKREESLQHFLAELAKPMIQSWLDRNLVRIVEDKVDEAINRMEKERD